jgi:GH15 family glucan-1,4-alpha-glucosidase
VSTNEYPPIEDYAAIGDCRSLALVSRGGSVDWLCWPNFASTAVFCALLDAERGGSFVVKPDDVRETTRRYVGETNVLETTFVTDTGVLRLTDLMVLGNEAMTGLEPERELLRVIEVVAGRVSLRVHYEPKLDFARSSPALRNVGERSIVHTSARDFLCLHTSLPLTVDADRRSAGTHALLRAGERHHLSLAYTSRDVGTFTLLGEHAERRRDETTRWWATWANACTPDVLFRDQVLRSALTLKMLAYALSGAIVAAPTTSLPEVIGGERNWDYRYCWLRDASLTLSAFMDLGYHGEARAFLDWLLHTTRLTRPGLNVMYDLYGNPRIPERILGHFEGYRGSKPVRIGNGASGQLQLDVYGAVCLAALNYVERGGRLDPLERRLLAGFGRVVERRWREPDNGIWEVREGRAHNTYSKLMCWVAMDSLRKLCERTRIPVDPAALESARGAIRVWIETQAYDPDRNTFVSRPGGASPDASLLSMVRLGFLDAHDERMTGTFERMQSELGRGALMLRYRYGEDALPGREGAFGLAGFWAVDYLARRGDVDEAHRRFESLLGYGNDLGLFAEETDPASGAHLGNFPQAFTHLALITAALSLERAMKKRTA